MLVAERGCLREGVARRPRMVGGMGMDELDSKARLRCRSVAGGRGSARAEGADTRCPERLDGWAAVSWPVPV